MFVEDIFFKLNLKVLKSTLYQNKYTKKPMFYEKEYQTAHFIWRRDIKSIIFGEVYRRYKKSVNRVNFPTFEDYFLCSEKTFLWAVVLKSNLFRGKNLTYFPSLKEGSLGLHFFLKEYPLKRSLLEKGKKLKINLALKKTRFKWSWCWRV